MPVAPTISVVIPCRNASATVGDAVRSALAQGLPPREVLVVDDGSDDASAAQAAVAGARVLRAPRRLHAGGARNLGLEAATGKLVAFLDADVRVAPDWLALAASVLAEHPRVGAVGGRVYDGRGGLWGRLDHYMNFSEWMSPHARACRAYPTIAVVYRREAIGEVRFPPTSLAEDIFFCEGVRSRGWGAWYEPQIRITRRHQRLGARQFWSRQLQSGRALYWSRRSLDRPGQVLVKHPALMWLLPHLWLLLARMLRNGLVLQAIVLLPWFVAGEVARAIGFLRARRDFDVEPVPAGVPP